MSIEQLSQVYYELFAESCTRTAATTPLLYVHFYLLFIFYEMEN